MKKLYKIKVLHAAPKDRHESIQGYVLAKNDLEVAEYISETYNYGNWFGTKYDEEPETRYADENCEKEIPFKDWVLLNKGDFNDEEGWEDAYYGVTKWGWEDMGVTSESEIEVLERFGIL